MLACHPSYCIRSGGEDLNGEDGCLSGLFVPHSNSVKPQLKWGVPEIREVGVFEKSVVCRGFFFVCVLHCIIFMCTCFFLYFFFTTLHSEDIFMK